MIHKRKLPFDPKVFLSKINGGRTVSRYGKNQVVCALGDPADSLSTFRVARSRRPSSPSRGRKPCREGRPELIIAKISQETLAEMIGTTRSRVSHFMNKVRQLGFINYNGHLEVHSSLLNVVLF